MLLNQNRQTHKASIPDGTFQYGWNHLSLGFPLSVLLYKRYKGFVVLLTGGGTEVEGCGDAALDPVAGAADDDTGDAALGGTGLALLLGTGDEDVSGTGDAGFGTGLAGLEDVGLADLGGVGGFGVTGECTGGVLGVTSIVGAMGACTRVKRSYIEIIIRS